MFKARGSSNLMHRSGLLSIAIVATAAIGCGSDTTNNGSANNGEATTEEISSNLSDRTLENRIEDPEAADYRVTKQIIAEGTLTVEPGVRVEFVSQAGLEITGTLAAKGTEEEPIVFTGTEETAGFWGGLKFRSDSVGNELTWTTVSYGGGKKYAGTDGAANVALATDARVKIANSTLSHSLEAGINARQGADFSGFADNTFSNNGSAAASIGADAASYMDGGTSFAGDNGTDAVVLHTGGTVEGEATWTKLDVPYFVDVNLSIAGNLTLEPGATLAFGSDNQLQTDGGTITAVGTAEDNVVFTAQTEMAGGWKGIRISSSSPDNRFEFCDIGFGGSSKLLSIGELSNIGIDNDGSATVTNSTIHDSAGFGIYSEGMLTESDNTFSANVLGEIGPIL